MSIKYYRLAKDEKLPEKFCAVKDVGGEPSKYVFYVPESENDKLRKALRDVLSNADDTVWVGNFETLAERMEELGIEVDA